MFNSENGYSLADIAAATGASHGGYAGDGFFGGSGWWIILLFLFAWGGWGNGGWNNGNSGATTIYGLDNLASTRDGFYDLNTSVLNGFSSAIAATNTGTSTIQSDICNMGLQNLQSANALQQTINQGTFGIAQQLAAMQSAQQLANCKTDSNIASSFATLNYNLATEACADRAAVTTGARDIIDNANANTRAILDFLVQDRITALTTENQALKGQISQSEQNAYLISQLRPVANPAYLVANPYTGYYGGYGYGGAYYGPSNIIA